MRKLDLVLEDEGGQLATMIAVWEDGTREWRENLGRVNQEAAVWQPYPDGPSIGGILLHMADADLWWLEEVAHGLPYRETPAGLYNLGVKQEQHVWPTPPKKPFRWFVQQLDEARARGFELIREADAHAWIPRTRTREIRYRWIVAHLVEHDSYHGGQMVLLHEMWKRMRTRVPE